MGFITFDYDEFDYTDHEIILDLYDDLCERDRLHLHNVVLTRYNVDLDEYYEQVFGEAPLHIREPNFEKSQKLEDFRSPRTKVIYFDNDIVTGCDLDWDEDIITPAVRSIRDAVKTNTDFGDGDNHCVVDMDCDIIQSSGLNASAQEIACLGQPISPGKAKGISEEQALAEARLLERQQLSPLPTTSNMLAVALPITNNPLSSVGSEPTHVIMQGVKRFCQVSGKLARSGKSSRRVHRDSFRKWSRYQTSDEARGFILQSDSIEDDPYDTNMEIQLDGTVSAEGEQIYKYHVQGHSVKVTKSQKVARGLISEGSIEYVFNDFHIVIDKGGTESQCVAKSVARLISNVFYGT